MSPVMQWANDSQGNLTHISKAVNGINCRMTCIGCNNPLIAKNNGKVRAPHFSHYDHNQGPCEGFIHAFVKHFLTEYINECIKTDHPGFPVAYRCPVCGGTHQWHIAKPRWYDFENDGEWSVADAANGILPTWFNTQWEQNLNEMRNQTRRLANTPFRATAEFNTPVNRPDILLTNVWGSPISTIEIKVSNLSEKAGALGKPVLVLQPKTELETLPAILLNAPDLLQRKYLVEGLLLPQTPPQKTLLPNITTTRHYALNIECPVCPTCQIDVSGGLPNGLHYRCQQCAAHINPNNKTHQCPPRYIAKRCSICYAPMNNTIHHNSHMAFEHGLTAPFTYNSINPSSTWLKFGDGDPYTENVPYGTPIQTWPTPQEHLNFQNAIRNR